MRSATAYFSNLHLNAVILHLKNEKLSSERAHLCTRMYIRHESGESQLQFTLLAIKCAQPVPLMRSMASRWLFNCNPFTGETMFELMFINTASTHAAVCVVFSARAPESAISVSLNSCDVDGALREIYASVLNECISTTSEIFIYGNNNNSREGTGMQITPKQPVFFCWILILLRRPN